MAIVGLHLTAQPAQVQNPIDTPQQMIVRHHIFEFEFVEKALLSANRLTHHRQPPSPLMSAIGNHPHPSRPKDFFDSLG